MAKNIALQLYSVRDVAAKMGYEDVVRKVAAMGYRGVETAGFPGTTAEAAAKLFHELGLTVTSAHVPLPVGENRQQVLETLDALGKPALVCTQIGPNDVKTLDTIKDLCERLNEGYAAARDHGLSFGIHNHWWEFEEIDGKLIHHLMKEQLDPGIFFEIDTYWVTVAGKDPVKILQELGPKAPMIHVKDGPAQKNQPMTAVGDGVVDIPAIVHAAVPNVWQIVELDSCATDILEAVQKSANYLNELK